jgi:hypothetical protein
MTVTERRHRTTEAALGEPVQRSRLVIVSALSALNNRATPRTSEQQSQELVEEWHICHAASSLPGSSGQGFPHAASSSWRA